ncbi:MAG: hypothetical protein WKG32_22340 [Gemmatimonadaceae bacterium]
MKITRRRLGRLTRLVLVPAVTLVAPVLVGSCGVLGSPQSSRVSGPAIPARLSDAEFWRMVTQFSEPGGYFRSDNFVSNETAFQFVIPSLQKQTPRGGVYFGVGPDQNFTYLVAMQPKIAFIVDIRRQNMLHHLLYKALVEMSADRAEFLSRLFSRPRPPGLNSQSTAEQLFTAYAMVEPDSARLRKNLAEVGEWLTTRHGFGLTDEDEAAIVYVYNAFFVEGPDLTYSFGRGRRMPYGYGGRGMPSYADLLVQTDGEGENRSYLGSEANYRILKELETNNLIVPLVGDFGGDKAIRSAGQYVRERGATVTVFYTSNVEQYLFQANGLENGGWEKFFTNVGTLPIDATSTFIRAVPNGFGAFPSNPTPGPGPRLATLLSSIGEVTKAFSEGRIRSYNDVIQMSR